MAPRNRSFFERLAGAVNVRDDWEDEKPEPAVQRPESIKSFVEEETQEGQLGVDVYQTRDEIVVKTMIAGVRPDDLEITITRDVVSIKGKREEAKTAVSEDYVHRELYWGAFTRTITLPQEIDPELAEAIERHGLLVIRLPKINKDKQTRVRVKSSV